VRPRALALLAFVLLAVAPAAASAQAPPDWTVELAGKVWVSSGWSNWNFKSAGVDPLTELRWRGVDAVLGEVSADVVWKRVVWMVSVGGTTLDQGVLIAEDFAASDRQGRFSVTRSPVDDGHVFYLNNDVGARLGEWRQPLFGAGAAPAAGYVDAFVGYQFWREEYVAVGLTGNLILPNGLVVNQGEPSTVKFATNEYTRHSIRLGMRTQIPLVGGLSLKALAVIVPYTHTDYEDTHHLQTGLRQPSVSTANGGIGTQLEAGLSYAVWRGLTADVGFRYWYFDSGEGEVVTRSTTGAVSRDTLNQAITERYGPYVGVRWKF
jgi:opacity protein-like surface antigen